MLYSSTSSLSENDQGSNPTRKQLFNGPFFFFSNKELFFLEFHKQLIYKNNLGKETMQK